MTINNAVVQLKLGKSADKLAQLERDHYCNFIGQSLAMQSVYKTIDSLAASDATGFIVGESGTGKELAAEAIHQQSPRQPLLLQLSSCLRTQRTMGRASPPLPVLARVRASSRPLNWKWLHLSTHRLRGWLSLPRQGAVSLQAA